jgi:cation transport ATPase
LFAFITQLSVLGTLILLLWMGWLLQFTMSQAISRRRHDTESLILIAGVAAMPLIFVADILWFVPTVWLAFFLLHGRARSQRLSRKSARAPSGRTAAAPITHYS